MLLPLLLVEALFKNHVDSFLQLWSICKFRINLLSKNTVSMIVWMDSIAHCISVLLLNQLLGVNDVVRGNTGVGSDFLN